MIRQITALGVCAILVFETAIVQGAAGDAARNAPTLEQLARERRAARLVDFDGWRAFRRDQSVFTFQRILTIFASQRRTRTQMRVLEISREELDAWSDLLTSIALEAEAVHLAADVVEVKRAYEELYARLERLVEESRDRSGGILGTIGGVVLNIAFAGFHLPVLGAAVAGGFRAAAGGGGIPEIIISMGIGAAAMSVATELSGAIATATAEAGEQASRFLSEGAAGLVDLGADQAGQAISDAVAEQPDLRPATALPVVDAVGHRADVDVPLRAWEIDLNGFAPDPDMLMRPVIWTAPEHRGDVETPARTPEPAVDTAVPSLSTLAKAARMRRVADPRAPVLTGFLLIGIDAEVRASRAQVRYLEILDGLRREWERELEHIRLEAEANHFWGERTEWLDAYDDLVDEYNRAVEKLQSSSGLFGTLVSLVIGAITTALGVPFVGAALAGAVGTALNGGSIGEVLFAAGLSGGVAYGSSLAIRALQGEVAPDGDPIEAAAGEQGNERAVLEANPPFDAAAGEQGNGRAAPGTPPPSDPIAHGRAESTPPGVSEPRTTSAPRRQAGPRTRTAARGASTPTDGEVDGADLHDLPPLPDSMDSVLAEFRHERSNGGVTSRFGVPKAQWRQAWPRPAVRPRQPFDGMTGAPGEPPLGTVLFSPVDAALGGVALLATASKATALRNHGGTPPDRRIRARQHRQEGNTRRRTSRAAPGAGKQGHQTQVAGHQGASRFKSEVMREEMRRPGRKIPRRRERQDAGRGAMPHQAWSLAHHAAGESGGRDA